MSTPHPPCGLTFRRRSLISVRMVCLKWSAACVRTYLYRNKTDGPLDHCKLQYQNQTQQLLMLCALSLCLFRISFQSRPFKILSSQNKIFTAKLFLFFLFLSVSIQVICLPTFQTITVTMSCPCGLTREELNAHEWVDNVSGECKAPFEDTHGVRQIGCEKLYVSHPSQGKRLYYYFNASCRNYILFFLVPHFFVALIFFSIYSFLVFNAELFVVVWPFSWSPIKIEKVRVSSG